MCAHFRDVLVSGEVRLTKPDPAIYRLALERFDLRAETALFVDDRQDNVDSATTLGMRAHLFRDAASLRAGLRAVGLRSEEHTSELQSLMRISYAVFCLKKTKSI